MAPIWHNYYHGIQKVMFVVDSINLMQLGAATLQFLAIVSHKNLSHVEVSFHELSSILYTMSTFSFASFAQCFGQYCSCF